MQASRNRRAAGAERRPPFSPPSCLQHPRSRPRAARRAEDCRRGGLHRRPRRSRGDDAGTDATLRVSRRPSVSWDRPRQNPLTVLIFIPYLTEGTIRGLFSGCIQLIENGYAVIIENVRGRYFSEGTYTYHRWKRTATTPSTGSRSSPGPGKVGTIAFVERRRAAQRTRRSIRPRRGGADGLRCRYRKGRAVQRDGKTSTAAERAGRVVRGTTARATSTTLPAGELTREQKLRISKFWNMEPELMPAPNLDSAVWTLPINKIMQNPRNAE